MGNDSFERPSIDVTVEVGNIVLSDTLYYGVTVDKEISVPKGNHAIKFRSTFGEAVYESTFDFDSVAYIDMRYSFGKSRTELRVLDLIKKQHKLDTAYFEDTKYLPKIDLQISKQPIKYN